MRPLGLSLLILTALLSARARAQYGWMAERYTTRNGLPQNSVIALSMDTMGFLWITTEGGLVRCDGSRFLRVPLSRTGDQGPERMRRLLPSREKDLYVEDARGQIYLIHGHTAVFRVPAQKSGGLAMSGGVPGIDLLIRILDTRSPLPGRRRWGTEQVNLLPKDLHTWYAQCDDVLLCYRDTLLMDSVELPAGCSRLFMDRGRIFGLTAEGAGFTIDEGAHDLRNIVIEDVRGRPITFNEGSPRVHWRADEPRAYVLTAQALYGLVGAASGDGLLAERFDLELPEHCRVTAVLYSEEHRMVAVGTDTKGLHIYHPRHMRTVVADITGSTTNSFYAQAPLPDGGLLAVNNHDSVVRFDKDGRMVRPSPVRVSSYEGIFSDSAGGIWYSPKRGLMRYDVLNGEHVRKVVANTSFTRYLREGDSLWVADQRGIHVLRGDHLRRVHGNKGNEAFRRAQFLRRKDAEHLWFGTCDGLYTLHAATGRVDTIEALRGRCVRAMEHLERYWMVGTYGSGAYVGGDDGFRRVPLDQHGYLSHVHAFMADEADGLWMSTNQGLFRMRREDVDSIVADTAYRPYYTWFGEWAGIESSEFNGGCDPTFVRLAGGEVSFPTIGGLVWFRPEAVQDQWPSAPILMEDVIVDGHTWPVDSFLVFDPDAHIIEVRFALPYWGDQENAQVEYVLNGRPGTWAPLNLGQRELRFHDLPPGEYELLVRKVGARGVAGQGQLWFNVERRWYQHTWAHALFVIGGVLLVWGLIKLNAVRLQRKTRRLEERVRMRTRALEEANRELQRSMELKHRLVSIISHDIVTPLRFIARVARSGTRADAPKDAEEMSGTLRDISFSADRLYTNARNTLSWIRSQEGGMELRPMHVALNPLVEEIFDVGRTLAQSKGLSLVNEVSLDDVPITDRDVLSIILHNLVTNAITHTDHGEVRVHGEQRSEGYVIAVSDTGPGMSTAAQSYIRSLRGEGGPDDTVPDREGEHGLGYVIILELVRLLGATITMSSCSRKGTVVRIMLPVG